MKKYVFLLVCLISAASYTNAQKIKFGKIDKADLQKKTCDYDSEANAEYLYHSTKIEFEYNDTYGRFDLVYYVHDRIKIYNQEGLDYANITIPYYIGGNNPDKEIISKLKAITFNLEGGKVKEVKLENKNIYDEESNKYYALKKFAMPVVKTGSILDIKYKLTSPRVFSVDEYFMQRDIPVKNAYYEVAIPEFFNYNVNIKGNIELNTEEEIEARNLNMSIDVDGYTYSSTNISRQTKEKTNVDYNVNIKRYSKNEIPALLEEPFVYSMDNYKSSIRMELLSTKYGNAKATFYNKDWDKVADILKSSNGFGPVLKKNYKDMNYLVEQVNGKTDEEKIAIIFQEFQSKFNWNGYYSIFAGDGVKKLIKEGTGNVSAINLLLVNVLQKAGLQAFPMVYKSMKSGNLNISNPTIDDLNYVIAVVQLEKGVVYLDATSSAVSPNMLPVRALNLRGVIIDGGKGLLVPITNVNKGSRTNFYTLGIEEESLTGTFQLRIKGYDAYKTRVGHQKEDVFIASLDTDDRICENVEVKDFLSNKNKIGADGEVTFSQGVRNVGDKIFIDLSILHQEFENPFTSEERTFAIFYDAAIKDNSIVKIAIPEGYEVESIPEKLVIASPEKQIKYLIEPKVQGAELIINIRETRSATIIEPSYYESVKQFYEQVQTKFQEKIVLAKN